MNVNDPFAGLTIEASRRALAAQFKASGIETPDLDARLLIGAALGLDHTRLAAQAARLITTDESKAIASFAQRRMAHEPVARILGHKEFWGLDFELSAATLGPGDPTPKPSSRPRLSFSGATPGSSRFASQTSARDPAPFCWRCCPNFRMRQASAPISVRLLSQLRS